MDLTAFYKRNKFWLKDFINGSPIEGPYKEIQWLSEHSFEEGKKKREEKLRRLFIHAQQNTRFYSKYHSFELSDYPVMKKKDLIDHHSEIAVPIEKTPRQEG